MLPFIVFLFRSIRVQVQTSASFVRVDQDGELMRTTAYFTTPFQDLDDVNSQDIERLRTDLESQLENWYTRGSSFVLDRILSFVLCICVYRPLTGSSFIETPEWLAVKKAVINVQNNDNVFCLGSFIGSRPATAPRRE